MSDGEDVPAVREHPLFVVAVWVSIALLIVTVIWLTVTLSPHTVKHPPSPSPWSCASVLARTSVTGAEGQIAPVCGQEPYPDAPGSGGEQ